MTSSRLINSLLKVSPGMIPRFFSQKMEANEPGEKKEEVLERKVQVMIKYWL